MRLPCVVDQQMRHSGQAIHFQPVCTMVQHEDASSILGFSFEGFLLPPC